MRARTIFVAGLLTAPALPALAATIYPNACLPTVVAPCYIANLSGPLLITDPAQVTFTITLTTLAGLTGNTALTTAFYTDPNGMLAADPTPIVQQSQNATAALVGAGNAPIAPNPGGAVVVTNSVTSLSSGFVDTPVTQRVDDYLHYDRGRAERRIDRIHSDVLSALRRPLRASGDRGGRLRHSLRRWRNIRRTAANFEHDEHHRQPTYFPGYRPNPPRVRRKSAPKPYSARPPLPSAMS